jgi:hypothetical protein
MMIVVVLEQKKVLQLNRTLVLPVDDHYKQDDNSDNEIGKEVFT